MPRQPKHFKIHCSIRNHRKTVGLLEDDAASAIYLRAGLMAVERFADQTEDSFLMSRSDLEWLANTRGGANAELKVGRAIAELPLTLTREGTAWRLTIPKFAIKQGFGPRKGALRANPATATPTATASPKSIGADSENRSFSAPQEPLFGHIETEGPATKSSHPGGAKPVKPAKAKRTVCPRLFTDAEKAEINAWNLKRPEAKRFTPGQLTHALEALHLWSVSDDNRKVSWTATFKRGIVKPDWLLVDYEGPPARSASTQAMIDDLAKQKENE